jgi:hypothetical protein
VKNKVALVTAVLVTAVYVTFIGLLWSRAADGDPQWTHELLLFSGIEAIAFAALGWLFGKEVNRHALDSAENAVARAHESAVHQGVVEGKGQALAAAVRSIDVEAEGLESATVAARGSLRSLRWLADELFPSN